MWMDFVFRNENRPKAKMLLNIGISLIPKKFCRMCLNMIYHHFNVTLGKVIEFRLVFWAFVDLKIQTQSLSSLDNRTGQILTAFSRVLQTTLMSDRISAGEGGRTHFLPGSKW